MNKYTPIINFKNELILNKISNYTVKLRGFTESEFYWNNENDSYYSKENYQNDDITSS